MIHFISRYFYEYHNNKIYWLTKSEKRRAMLLTCAIVVCVIIIAVLWALR